MEAAFRQDQELRHRIDLAPRDCGCLLCLPRRLPSWRKNSNRSLGYLIGDGKRRPGGPGRRKGISFGGCPNKVFHNRRLPPQVSKPVPGGPPMTPEGITRMLTAILSANVKNALGTPCLSPKTMGMLFPGITRSQSAVRRPPTAAKRIYPLTPQIAKRPDRAPLLSLS